MRRSIGVAALLVAVALGASSCAGEDQIGSASHRMSEWVSGTELGGDIGTLNADNARVPLEVPNGTGGMHAGCATLVNDAEAANGELPAPDSTVTDWLTTAYGLEGSAGTECYNAGVTNKKLLAEAERDMAKAHVLFERVVIRIQSIDGAVVATTTTTDNSTGNIFG